jgi:multidrug resistance efflux pump
MKTVGMSWARRAAALLLTGLAAGACGGAAAETPAAEVPIVVDTGQIIAEGRLVPSESVQLGFKTGGVVAQVLVEEGEAVQAGQPLALLANAEQAEAAVAAARLELVSAEQALELLHEQAGVMSAQAQQEVADAREGLRKARYTWDVQQQGNRASQSTLNGAEARLLLADDALDQAQEAVDDLSGRDEDDLQRALALTELSGAQLEYDAALRALNWYRGKPTEIQQAMLDADVAMAEARLEQALQVWQDRQNGPDPDELALAEARLANARAQLSAAETALADLQLQAPFAGTVAHVALNEGELVTAGQPAVVIADYSVWVVETDNLTEFEVPGVAVGQPAVVGFDALPDLELAGTVTAVSPYFEIKRGDVTYTVEIQLQETDPRLRWGLTTTVTFGEPPSGVLPAFAPRAGLGH